MALIRKLKKQAKRRVIGSLKDQDVTIDEATHLKEEERDWREGQAHERHQTDELETVDKGPERLHGGLA